MKLETSINYYCISSLNAINVNNYDTQAYP